MGGSSRALQHLAETSLQQGEYASAIEFFLSLSRLNPADAELQYQIGLLYAATEPIKSLPYLSTAAVMNPSVAVNSKKLQDEIRTASLFDQPAYTLLVSGRQLGSMGEWQLASEAMKRATEADPEYPDAWAYLGEARQHVNNVNGTVNPDAGLSELSHALQLDDQSVIANFLMGLYWERQVDYAKAKSYLEQAASINPADPYIYAELGNILSKEGDLPAAQDNLKKAVSLAPKNPTFYRLLAQFALENQIQIRPLALPAARQALMLGPQDPESLDLMAKIMLELEDFHAAEQYARQAVDADPGYAPGYFHLGMAYIFLNQADQARKWLEAARNADTDSWVTAQASRMLDYYFP